MRRKAMKMGMAQLKNIIVRRKIVSLAGVKGVWLACVIEKTSAALATTMAALVA